VRGVRTPHVQRTTSKWMRHSVERAPGLAASAAIRQRIRWPSGNTRCLAKVCISVYLVDKRNRQGSVSRSIIGTGHSLNGRYILVWY